MFFESQIFILTKKKSPARKKIYIIRHNYPISQSLTVYSFICQEKIYIFYIIRRNYPISQSIINHVFFKSQIFIPTKKIIESFGKNT